MLLEVLTSMHDPYTCERPLLGLVIFSSPPQARRRASARIPVTARCMAVDAPAQAFSTLVTGMRSIPIPQAPPGRGMQPANIPEGVREKAACIAFAQSASSSAGAMASSAMFRTLIRYFEAYHSVPMTYAPFISAPQYHPPAVIDRVSFEPSSSFRRASRNFSIRLSRRNRQRAVASSPPRRPPGCSRPSRRWVLHVWSVVFVLHHCTSREQRDVSVLNMSKSFSAPTGGRGASSPARARSVLHGGRTRPEPPVKYAPWWRYGQRELCHAS